jgi:hypothetical protein
MGTHHRSYHNHHNPQELPRELPRVRLHACSFRRSRMSHIQLGLVLEWWSWLGSSGIGRSYRSLQDSVSSYWGSW